MWNIGMPLFGFNNYNNFGFGHYNLNYNMNNYNPLFNFSNFSNFNYVPSLPMYSLPNFNFTGFLSGTNFNFGGGAVATNNTVAISEADKTKINDIRKMKYDDSNIMSKASEITDFNVWSNYLTGDNSLTSSKIDNDENKLVYKDKDGNIVGSIRKENGKIVNISLKIDGGEFIINAKDNKITNMVASDEFRTNDKNVGKTFDQILKGYLNNEFKGVEGETEQREDESITRYTKSDGQYLNVIKDKSGKIKEILYASENTKTNQTLHHFADEDGDGKIGAGEQQIRYDIIKNYS